MSGSQARIVLYILRRDVRLSDNPIFHYASQQLERRKSSSSPTGDARGREDSLTSGHASAPFTHLLPVYVFPSHQIESSGFLSSPSDKSPYPEARSPIARLWRTGPHRAKFIGQGVWDLKTKLEALQCGSGLEMRVGMVEDVVRNMLESYANENGDDDTKSKITHIWMTDDEGTEEQDDQNRVEKLAKEYGAEFKAWQDEKFYVDEYVLTKYVPVHRRTSLMFSVATNHSKTYQNYLMYIPRIENPLSL